MQRAYREVAILGELVQREQVFTISILGLGERRVVMPRLIVDVDFLTNIVDVFTIVVADGVFHVPLHHLAVDKQGGIGITAPVVSGV